MWRLGLLLLSLGILSISSFSHRLVAGGLGDYWSCNISKILLIFVVNVGQLTPPSPRFGSTSGLLIINVLLSNCEVVLNSSTVLVFGGVTAVGKEGNRMLA